MRAVWEGRWIRLFGDSLVAGMAGFEMSPLRGWRFPRTWFPTLTRLGYVDVAAPRLAVGGSVEDGQSCPSPRENVPEAGILVDPRFDGQDCPSSTHPAGYGPSRAIKRRVV